MATANCVNLWKMMETEGQTEKEQKKLSLNVQNNPPHHPPAQAINLQYKHASNKQKPLDTTHYFWENIKEIFLNTADCYVYLRKVSDQ